MPFIGANGILVLIPCAVVLDRWASTGTFDTGFYVVQGVELLAGAISLILMGMNDGGSGGIQTLNNKGNTLVSLSTNLAGEGTIITENGKGEKTSALP